MPSSLLVSKLKQCIIIFFVIHVVSCDLKVLRQISEKKSKLAKKKKAPEGLLREVYRPLVMRQISSDLR